MYCNDCGLQIPDGSATCPYCGTSTRIIDPHAMHRERIRGNQSASAAGQTAKQSSRQSASSNNSSSAGTKRPSQKKPQPQKSPSSTGVNKSSSSSSSGVTIGAAVLIVGVIAFLVIQKTGIQLPFGKSKTDPQPAPVSAVQDNNEETVKTETDPVQTQEPVNNTPEPTVSSVKGVFTNNAIESAVCEYFGVSSSSQLSGSDLAGIEEMDISAYEIIINGESFEVTSQIGDIDLCETGDYLSGLKTLAIRSARNVSASGWGDMNFTKLTIEDANVSNNLKGIENAGNLKTLVIHNTDLRSLEYIGDCPSLTKLYASKNQIYDIESLRGNSQIKKITLFGNQIKDYTALSEIETVNVWGGNIDNLGPSSYALDQRPDGYCFKVNVYNLHMRDMPSKSGTILIPHIPEKYYIVLDTKRADGYTWYKVGNDAWVGDNGNWLTFYN